MGAISAPPGFFSVAQKQSVYQRGTFSIFTSINLTPFSSKTKKIERDVFKWRFGNVMPCHFASKWQMFEGS